jgi:LmbE family N-acetylglucosaminyl deacetylase
VAETGAQSPDNNAEKGADTPYTTAARDISPERVLAIYAHPDDPFISCGGTLKLWAEQGSNIDMIICTRGEKGSYDPSQSTQELAEIRRIEIDRAAKVIQCNTPILLGYPDGELSDDLELIEVLVGHIRQLKPEVVLCPDPTAIVFGEEYINHRDHRIVGMAVLDALSPAAALPLYFPDRGSPHSVRCAYMTGTLEASIRIDITNTIDAKIAAVKCHQSQLKDYHDIDDLIRTRAQEEGNAAGMRYAEGFRRINITI